jgi:uncharacterized membrane protein SpoIIM required for sporulation
VTALTMRRLVCANAIALVCAGCCGAALAAAQERRVFLTHSDTQARVDISRSIAVIVRGNGAVWLYVAAGTVSFGAAGTVVLVSNGFRFGMDVAAVALSEPRELRFLLPHSLLEFGAFTLAAGACQWLGWLLFQFLAFNRRGSGAAAGVGALAASACLGCLAAVVEALSLAARFS